MSIFEILMLLCFGLAWPFSIYKSIKTKQNGGKSVIFLAALLLGYAAGITHKILYSPDLVIIFYALNALMVSIELVLFYKNKRRNLSMAA